MMKTYNISCHCGGVQAQFRRQQHLPLTVWDCNCSDCAMRKNIHFMVRASDFWLVDGSGIGEISGTSEGDASKKVSASEAAAQKLAHETILYQWGTKTAVRRFCRTCGILPFYVPRSNPDGYAITFPCVDWGDDGPPETEVRLFDGVNWEQSHSATGIAKETSVSEDK
ncbi:hypothetical protein ACHAXR_012579 [Thalassiosira sp. AJA248-18]